jgi:hypothetical protein
LRSARSLEEIYERQINLHSFIRMTYEDPHHTYPRRSRSSILSPLS